MRKSHFIAALIMVAFGATFAFGKSTSFIGGRMSVVLGKNGFSAPSSGACSNPSLPYASNCPTAPGPSSTPNCSCIQVPQADVRGASIGTGTAHLYLTEDSGDGNGTDGAVTLSNCFPVFGGGVFTQNKTGARATLNIQGTLCGTTFYGGYTVVEGGNAGGTVTGLVVDESTKQGLTLSFVPE